RMDLAGMCSSAKFAENTNLSGLKYLTALGEGGEIQQAVFRICLPVLKHGPSTAYGGKGR
ncbi:MAG: hypothetical protein JW829_12455, partial [Pirellulales bacterium]|nr:hypothetical protein [Pirellulales bacterium]